MSKADADHIARVAHEASDLLGPPDPGQIAEGDPPSAVKLLNPLGELEKVKLLVQGKTVLLRVTVLQEITEIFQAPCHCRVTLLTPPQPRLYLDFDRAPNDIGPDRIYKMPVLPPQFAIPPFVLCAGQIMIAAAERGECTFAILVEPLSHGGHHG